MFIRIKKQLNKETLLSAVLVESQRIAGKPRQKILGYISSIRETNLHLVPCRLNFWNKAEEKLNTMNLSDIERKNIYLKLEKFVSKVTPEEQQNFELYQSAMLKELLR